MKLVLINIIISPFIGFMTHKDFNEAKNFRTEGIVTEARWNTTNHKMSLFKKHIANINKNK